MEKQDGIWLNKYISESGFCSRREADKYIEKGLVYINKSKAQKGAQVFVGDIVRVNGLELEPRQKDEIIFIAFNKPVGIVSTTEKNVKDNIIDYINYGVRIFPIGRLDKDSQGLIFLTNNGDLVNRILRAGNKHEKEYIVTVNKPLTEAVLKGMADGVPMLGVTTKKCKIIQESPKVFRITLVQGLNRQIRRMCEHYHYDVVKLERTRIMHISLKGIPLGEWRELSEIEMNEIYRLTKDSSSEVIKKKKSDATVSTTEAKPKQRTSNKSIDSKKTFANKVSQNKLEDGTKNNNKLSSQTKQSKSSNFKSYRKKGSR
jgi:23S rRNA pseudouridine2604 synthase